MTTAECQPAQCNKGTEGSNRLKSFSGARSCLSLSVDAMAPGRMARLTTCARRARWENRRWNGLQLIRRFDQEPRAVLLREQMPTAHPNFMNSTDCWTHCFCGSRGASKEAAPMAEPISRIRGTKLMQWWHAKRTGRW